MKLILKNSTYNRIYFSRYIYLKTHLIVSPLLIRPFDCYQQTSPFQVSKHLMDSKKKKSATAPVTYNPESHDKYSETEIVRPARDCRGES